MSDLIKRFQKEAAANESMDERMRQRSRFKVPLELYDTLHEIHRRSLEMAVRLLEVFEDDEHKFMMEFGRMSRVDLPDLDKVHADIAIYAEFLSAFNPEDVRFNEEDQSVSVPADTILKMAQMLQYNNSVLQNIEDNLQNTGYMQIFTDAKAAGLIYSGKSALAEILNLAVAAQIIDKNHSAALKPAKWPSASYKEALPKNPRSPH